MGFLHFCSFHKQSNDCFCSGLFFKNVGARSSLGRLRSRDLVGWLASLVKTMALAGAQFRDAYCHL